MRSSTAIVLQAGRGGRPLVQTADSILRSMRPPAATIVALSPEHPHPTLLESVTARLNASVAAMHDAVASAHSASVLLVHAGHMLDEDCLDQCDAIFVADPAASAVALSVRLQTADATGYIVRNPSGTTPVAVLNDTRTVPDAFVVRRDVFDALGGFDESFGKLAGYEFWLRLTLAEHKVVLTERPLIARDVWTAEAAPDLHLFRAVLEKHAPAIQEVMHEVLVAREVRFGQLRETHRELMARRDAGLAELDRLRAEAAHERAYIAHHGREELEWGDLRHTDPVSRDWGYDRGMPVDRRYIDEFLCAHSSDVRGSVLEIQENDFTRTCGGPRVAASEVLDIDESNPRATVLADLRCAPGVPAERFDCVILTQTLHVIDDMGAALRECHRMLKPGGVLLATIPAASRVCLEYGHDGDFWRATPAGARALFRSAFVPSAVTASAFGNVLTNVAFLQGVSAGEIGEGEFTGYDPYFPALTGVRARKGSFHPARSARGIVLLYHRIEDTDGPLDLSVPPALFETQLDWLRSHCTVLPLETLLESPPDSLPPRAVAVTFDDGYLDSLTTVAPLLERYRLPATFFLTSRWLDQEGEYWWDVLERAMPGGDEAGLHDRLVHATLDDRETEVRNHLTARAVGAARVRPMLAGEARRLAAFPGVTIGAHSVNHLALPDQDLDVMRREITDSCAALTRVTGTPVNVFAYPYGAYDRVSASIVRASCRWGMSCDARPLTESFDAAIVPRLDVKRWDASELAARVEQRFRVR